MELLLARFRAIFAPSSYVGESRPDVEDMEAWPSVVVSSDMSPRNVCISVLSFSASLLILMNWVLFW